MVHSPSSRKRRNSLSANGSRRARVLDLLLKMAAKEALNTGVDERRVSELSDEIIELTGVGRLENGSQRRLRRVLRIGFQIGWDAVADFGLGFMRPRTALSRRLTQK